MVYNLPLEFRKPHNLMNIAMGVSVSIKIDPLTLSLYHGMFARILVAVDLSKLLTRRVLVTMKEQTSGLDIEFFADVEFESIRKYCVHCNVIGHEAMECRNGARLFINQEPQRQWRPGTRDMATNRQEEG